MRNVLAASLVLSLVIAGRAHAGEPLLTGEMSPRQLHFPRARAMRNGGIALVSLGTGMLLLSHGLMAEGALEGFGIAYGGHPTPALEAEQRSLINGSWATLAIGGSMLVSGIVLWVVGGKRMSSTVSDLHVGMAPLKGGGSVGASFAF
jgi:hypothetical protein